MEAVTEVTVTAVVVTVAAVTLLTATPEADLDIRRTITIVVIDRLVTCTIALLQRLPIRPKTQTMTEVTLPVLRKTEITVVIDLETELDGLACGFFVVKMKTYALCFIWIWCQSPFSVIYPQYSQIVELITRH